MYKRVLPRLKFVDQKLNQQDYMVNNQFSVLDAYLFVMTNWIYRLDYSFKDLNNLKRFDSNMRKRSAVSKVLSQEGKPHSLQEKRN
ncbi:hypothetical protein FD46_GL001101 [Liquorilactobacillus oeni DSM 19972]|uniref:GST C-terminal domain-containing protein n=1 Tax=Liquorilactobacillus oeni DSM 19972 TaxID=1423777 RepID=A0A0R1MAI7_9LACO|nr:hypothetical protein FD46_GL001101 [Liquorilactobacillus oeni DSM 19972]